MKISSLVLLLSCPAACSDGFKTTAGDLNNIQSVNQEMRASSPYGALDPYCQLSNEYDACLFLKNPVASRRKAYPTHLRFGSNLEEDQIFGVQLRNRINNNRLESLSINVYASSGETLSSINHLKQKYTDDLGKHYVAQIMAYFWLTEQERIMKEKTGEFYASGKRIPVDAYNEGIQNNAYWDGENIVMGVVTEQNSRVHEMSLSSEIIIHEMGHANFQHAVGRFLRDENSSDNGSNCLSLSGCLGAINEGQADFHFALMFPEQTALGETFANSLNGLTSDRISRDVAKLSDLNVSQTYRSSNGEIHAMGSLYASILWEIYNHPRMQKADFEKIFSKHLRKFSGSSRFQEAKQILFAEDLALFNGKYRLAIEEVFARKGL